MPHLPWFQRCYRYYLFVQTLKGIYSAQISCVVLSKNIWEENKIPEKMEQLFLFKLRYRELEKGDEKDNIFFNQG